MFASCFRGVRRRGGAFPSPALPAVLLAAVIGVAGVAATEEPIENPESALLTNARQLTFEGRRAGEGYFDATGTRMVFQSEREPGNPFYQIYLMDLETGDLERVSTGTGKTTCAWIHPDGERVLFASTHADPDSKRKQQEEIDFRASGQERRYAWDYDEHFDLYVRDLESGELRRLTHARGYDAEGSFSPDGGLITFSSNRHAYSGPLSEKDAEIFELDKSYLLDLYIMDSDGSNVRRLTDVKGYDGGPFFSPDGERICWRRFSENGATAEIYTMKIDGSDVRQLTELGAMSWAPFYHPSGEYLIFTTNRHGFANFELYLVATDGRGEPVRVTFTPGFDGLPVFSPDGRCLAWTTNRAGGREGQIFIGDWNHEEASKLVRRARSEAADEAARASELAAEVEAMLAGTKPAIRTEDLELHVRNLASEVMAGRQTGTRGERLATEYVARLFERIGLEPAGDAGSYFQEFDFTAGVSVGGNNRLVVGRDGERTPLRIDVDFRPLAFSQSGAFDAAPVVFAGYGIHAPAANGFAAYDSYEGLDVTGKWVLVLRFLPEDITPERRQSLARTSSLRYKATLARDRGARGLLVVTGPRASVKERLVPLGTDATLAGTSIAAVSISDEVGERLVAGTGRSLEELQQALDGGATVPGFVLPEVQVSASIELERVKREGRNVLARLVASGDEARARPDLVIGAHVDHLGRGGGGSSLASENEAGAIHYGADDNASGVAAVIEIAEYLADLARRGKLDLERDVLFAAWSGEEMGLLGSNHFVDDARRDLGGPESLQGAFSACLNFDMVGRLEDELVLSGIGSSTAWRREIERRNAPVGLPISLQEDAYLPTDATSFYLAGVPILSFFTGAHAEYHTPRDTIDRIDFPGMAKIARLGALVARSLALDTESPDYLEQEKPEATASRAGLRVYLGTIPDYAEAEIPGLRLQGVGKGGPAYEAGLRAGDIVVELGGKTIENIYDYTYALDLLKVGEPVEVVVVRGRERLRFTVIPGSRE